MWYLLALMFLVDIAAGLPESPRFVIKMNYSVCLKQGMHTMVFCTLSLNTSSVNITRPVESLSLIWYENGSLVQNATITNRTTDQIVSVYRASNAGLLTCCVTSASSPKSLANRSLSIEMQPGPVTGLVGTPRFTSDKETLRYVSVSWVREGMNYAYTLFYQIYSGICFYIPCLEGSIKPTCDDKTCTAQIYTEGFEMMSQLKFHVITHRGNCETRSKFWKYNLTLMACDDLAPKSLFYIPYPPKKLEIKTSYRRVTLKWKDILYWVSTNVLLTYTCSQTSANHTMALQNLEIREIILSDKNIRGYAPYERCTFCLSIKEYQCGRFSEPLCNTTNLNEEPPSEAPNITCTHDSCPSRYDAKYRNLTVTWELPAEKYWGGILREIRLRYWPTFPNASDTTSNEIVVRNVSKKSILLHLNRTIDYKAHLQVCNREGCSGYSQPLQIYSVRSPKHVSKSSDNYLLPVYIASAASVLLLIGITSTVAIRVRLCKTPSKPLEQLSEPDPPHYDSPHEEPDYNKLDGDNNETLHSIERGR